MSDNSRPSHDVPNKYRGETADVFRGIASAFSEGSKDATSSSADSFFDMPLEEKGAKLKLLKHLQEIGKSAPLTEDGAKVMEACMKDMAMLQVPNSVYKMTAKEAHEQAVNAAVRKIKTMIYNNLDNFTVKLSVSEGWSADTIQEIRDVLGKENYKTNLLDTPGTPTTLTVTW